jgi:hypothetical protein
MKMSLDALSSALVGSTLWALLLLSSSQAQAGRPFATEDAGVLESGQCEWESVAARARTQGESAETGWSTQLGCGLGFKTQLALAFGRSTRESEHTNTLTLGGKTGLIHSGEDATSVTLAYGLNSSKEPGHSAYRWDTSAVNLVVTQPLPADWTVHANLGWSRDRPTKLNTTTWAVAAEWAASEQWALGAEVYGDDRSRPWYGVGARWDFSAAWSVNAAYAVNRETPHTHAVSVGFKFAF